MPTRSAMARRYRRSDHSASGHRTHVSGSDATTRSTTGGRTSQRDCRASRECQAERGVDATIEAAERVRLAARRDQIGPSGEPEYRPCEENGDDGDQPGSAEDRGYEPGVQHEGGGAQHRSAHRRARCRRGNLVGADHPIGQRRTISERNRRAECPREVQRTHTGHRCRGGRHHHTIEAHSQRARWVLRLMASTISGQRLRGRS